MKNGTTIRKAIVAAFGAGCLLLGIHGSTLAQTTAPVDVEVVADANAAVTVTLSAVDFAPVTYSNDDQTASGAVVIVSAEDTRGSAAGWTVTLSGTVFDGANTADTISVENLSLSSSQVTGGPGTLPTGSSLASVTGTGQTVLTAGAGAGNGFYNQSLIASLDVEGGTLVDTYTSTLTVTITGTAP